MSQITSVKVLEKKLNPSGSVLFDEYIQKFVSNYLFTWGLHNDNTLNIFYGANPPIQLEGVSKVYRGYALGGANDRRKIIANAWDESTPQNAKDLTGLRDIDGEHVHGLALLNNGTITGWTKTGYVNAMGNRQWATENSTLWKQSRHSVTGGKFLTGVKKIGADFQASFALLSGDILTGWGNMGETWINPGYASIGRGPAVYFINKNDNRKKWKAFNFGHNLPFQPASVKWNWYKNGIASYESGNATHVVRTYFQNWSADAQPQLRGLFWPEGLPTASGKFSSYVSSNYELSVLTVSGGDNWITTSGSAQRNNNNPYERVVIGGPKSWVGGFMYVKPSRDTYYNPTLWNLPAISQNPQTSGFGLKTILLENDGDIWVSTDTGFQNWSTKGINKKWLGLAYNAGASVSFRTPISNILVSDNFTYGKYITAFTNSGYLWVSNDTGETWAQKGTLQNWSCAAISAEGRYQIAGANSGYLWKSEDYGQNWTQITNLGIKNWKSVSLFGPSKDWVGKYDTGRNLITNEFAEAAYISAVSEDNLWISYDSGTSWNSKLGGSVFSLNNGTVSGPTKIIGGEDDTLIPDSGLMFVANNLGTDGYYTGPASPEIPFASYPNIYLTGVKDFDVGQNYITILLKTGSDELFQLSGFGNARPVRLNKDGLNNVKKVVSTRDHTFALVKNGDRSIISGWGLEETNLSQFERWIWNSYGGISGWFSGYIHGAKDWTGIKDFDIGYNHGIAIFEDDRASGWGGEQPVEVKGLIGQINNRYKNVNEKEVNFYLDTPSFSGNEISYYTDVADWIFKYDNSLDRWILTESENQNNVAYMARSAGSGGLVGSWDGVGNYNGQELEVKNNSVQTIYPVEAGETYISNVTDVDWIDVPNKNQIFSWNRAIVYTGKKINQIQIYNFPSGFGYGQENEFSYLGGGQEEILDSSTYGSVWTTGFILNNQNSLLGPSISISKDGRYQTMVSDKIYVSQNSGQSWVAALDQTGWKDIALSKNGQTQLAIQNRTYPKNCDQIWISNNYGVTWNDPGTSLPDIAGAMAWRETEVGGRMNSILPVQTDSSAPLSDLLVFSSGNIKYIYSLQDNLFQNGLDLFDIPEGENWIGGAVSSESDSFFKYLTFIRDNKPILVSSNVGSTFTEKLASGKWLDVAMSKNGKYQIVTSSGQGVWMSQDYGSEWYALPFFTNAVYPKVKMSEDGRYQTVLRHNFGIHTSKDYGLSWQIQSNQNNWKDLDVSSIGTMQVATAISGVTLTAPNTSFYSRSLTSKKIEARTKLYPTIDYPLTVYRESSGVSASNPILKNGSTEVFLYQRNSKDARWALSLKYSCCGSTTVREKEITTRRKSINEIGYALPPSGEWGTFSIESSGSFFKDLNVSGLRLDFNTANLIDLIDERVGYMNDLRYNINYSKILPNYSNDSQISYWPDNVIKHSKFGSNILVQDAESSTWKFNADDLKLSNPHMTGFVARFSADPGVNWDQQIICNGYPVSVNLQGILNDEPLRTIDYQTSGSFDGAKWYILLKVVGQGTGTPLYNVSSGSKFVWKAPYIYDKASNTKLPMSGEIYWGPAVASGLSVWQPCPHGRVFSQAGGVCYQYQIRISHPLMYSGGFTLPGNPRNIWPLLSTTGIYSGSYLWNGREDESSGLAPSLSLQRGKEYRFIQKGPINSENKLKIYPTSGIHVFEHDASNALDYHCIRVIIDSDTISDTSIRWSKGDGTYLSNFTGQFPSTRGSNFIGTFYQKDITGLVVNESNPNFREYVYNDVTGNWVASGQSKITGTIIYDNKVHPAEFWRFADGSTFNTWESNFINGQKALNSYAFIRSGGQQIPFYGIMQQTSRDINFEARNPSGNQNNTKNIWGGRFGIIGKNEFTSASNHFVEMPPGYIVPFDIHVCTDYNTPNDTSLWDKLLAPLPVRSGIFQFSGIETSGHFFKNKFDYFSARKEIILSADAISNIIFVPPTQARLQANELIFWTGQTSNGPWQEVTGRVEGFNGKAASIWGGTQNFWNANSLEYGPEATLDSVFGNVWQLIQIYIPNTSLNLSNIYAKIGRKGTASNCTTCGHTTISIVGKAETLPVNVKGGYMQLISGQNNFISGSDYRERINSVFKGNIYAWSSDPAFVKQIPVLLTGAVDYINYQ
jgi:hypothetical protein